MGMRIGISREYNWWGCSNMYANIWTTSQDVHCSGCTQMCATFSSLQVHECNCDGLQVGGIIFTFCENQCSGVSHSVL